MKVTRHPIRESILNPLFYLKGHKKKGDFSNIQKPFAKNPQLVFFFHRDTTLQEYVDNLPDFLPLKANYPYIRIW